MSPSCHLLFQHCSLLLSVFCKHSVFNKGVYLQGLKTLRKQSFLGNFTVTDYRVSQQLSLQQFGSMSETISRVRQLTEKGSKMEGWDDCWKAGLTPWDRGSSLPILCELCKEDALPNGYALVPGCGRGYDVLTLASAARVAIGLDCSEEAKKQAEQLRDSRGVPSQRAQFVVGNFFDFPFSQKFDLVYDLTFFCALPPESRNSWANRMKEIIQVDGELVTVVFPIGDYEGGPPYAMNLDIYKQLLEPLGFESFYMKNISDQLPPSSIFVRWKLRH